MNIILIYKIVNNFQAIRGQKNPRLVAGEDGPGIDAAGGWPALGCTLILILFQHSADTSAVVAWELAHELIAAAEAQEVGFTGTTRI